MTFDRRAFYSLIKEMIQTGEYEDVGARIRELAEKDPHEYYLAQLQLELTNLNGLVSVLHDIGIDQEPYFRVVAFALWFLGVRAKEADYLLYTEFIEKFKRRLVFDLEIMKRMGHPHPLTPESDLSNVSECLNAMRDFLETYQRRLRFYRGLLDIVRNKKPSLRRLDRLSVPRMEKGLSSSFKALGKGIVLGSEYRHVRNSLGHNQWRVYEKERAVEFVDRNQRTGDVWKRKYDYVSFAVLYRHLFIFMCAMELADAASRVAEFSYLAEASDESDSRDK